ncbi:MAG: 50S ribosomal protein L28 [Candidatus Magasanikbacteria bacterium]
MSKCELCKKGSQKSASRSHSKVKTIKRQNVNLQKMDGKLICSSCRRTSAKKMLLATA